MHKLLEEKAAQKNVYESGLMALDWQTLLTKIEDIYRAYMEATAFGTKMIMKSYEC